MWFQPDGGPPHFDINETFFMTRSPTEGSGGGKKWNGHLFPEI